MRRQQAEKKTPSWIELKSSTTSLLEIGECSVRPIRGRAKAKQAEFTDNAGGRSNWMDGSLIDRPVKVD